MTVQTAKIAANNSNSKIIWQIRKVKDDCICAKVRNKFNVSIVEVEEQDLHQIIVLGIAFVTNDHGQADSIADHVINFIDSSTEGDLINIEKGGY